MARKDTINVNDIVDKIINTDNIRERIKEKGEQAGKEAAKGFTSGFESGAKKGIKSSKAKASSGISIEMADFLKEMIDAGETIEVKCHFCNSAYHFTVEQLKEILASRTSRAGEGE